MFFYSQQSIMLRNLFGRYASFPVSKCTIRRFSSNNNIVNNDFLTISLVGRPNTGKSTLYNRLTLSKQAIVSNIPGTTRDRREGYGYLSDFKFKVIDTGGLDDRGSVSTNIQDQVKKSLLISDVVIFMLDAREGVTALDEHFAAWLRKEITRKRDLDHAEGANIDKEKVIIIAANKTEGGHQNARVLETVAESYSLGFGDPVLISAANGDGMADLAQVLIQYAEENGYNTSHSNEHDRSKQSSTDTEFHHHTTTGVAVEDRVIQMAIMGRPNVGKSTLLNAFVGEDRVIAGPLPGLTRDSIVVEWRHSDRLFRLVDTAGLTRIRNNKQLLEVAIQKEKKATFHENSLGSDSSNTVTGFGKVKLPGRMSTEVELDPSQHSYQIAEYSLSSALNALNSSQVVLLVIESTQGTFNKIDLQLAKKCLDEGRALVIAANKADIINDKYNISDKEYYNTVKEHVNYYMKEYSTVPIIITSGINNSGVNKILDTVITVHDSWSKRINTGLLNEWLKDLLITNPIPNIKNKRLKLKYITQVKSRPPTFALFMNVETIPKMVERYLKGNIQQSFQLYGVPIRFIIHKTKQYKRNTTTTTTSTTSNSTDSKSNSKKINNNNKLTRGKNGGIKKIKNFRIKSPPIKNKKKIWYNSK